MASTTFTLTGAGFGPGADLSAGGATGYYAPGVTGQPPVPNILNMNGNDYNPHVTAGYSDLESVNPWLFSPSPTTGLFSNAITTTNTAKYAIVFVSDFVGPQLDATQSFIEIFTDPLGFTNVAATTAVDLYIPSMAAYQWHLSTGIGSNAITIDRAPGPVDPFWFTFQFSNPDYLDVYQYNLDGTPSATFGMQGVAVSSAFLPPPACFGAGTLVLCGDGTRKNVADLPPRVQVLALPNDIDWAEDGTPLPLVPIDVDVYFRSTVVHPEQVATIAPSVHVSKEHTVCMMGRPSPATLKHTTSWHCMGGPFKDCAWMAKTLPGFDPQWTLTGLYHFVPVDRAHREYGLVVGEDNTCVAEMFRSDVSVLTRTLGFGPKKA